MNEFIDEDFDALFSQTSNKSASYLYTVFDELVEDLPRISIVELSDIPEPIENEQIYRLSVLPQVEVISKLCDLNYEVGLISVKDCLFLAIASENAIDDINLPNTLKLMSRKKLFQLDFHSHRHPKNVPELELSKGEYSVDWPGRVSADDLTFCNNTVNRQLGIGEFNGLITITVPSIPLPKLEAYDTLKFDSFNNIEESKVKLGQALRSFNKDYDNEDLSNIKLLHINRSFLKQYFAYRLIPWDNKADINNWFSNQLKLTVNL